MPVYVYRCKKCQCTTELIQSFKEGEEYLAEGKYRCGNPDCQHTEGERVIGSTSFILSGRGWFSDGYS